MEQLPPKRNSALLILSSGTKRMFGASRVSDELDRPNVLGARKRGERKALHGRARVGPEQLSRRTGGKTAACTLTAKSRKEAQKSQNVRVPTRRSTAWLDPSLSSENVKSISITFRISENSQATLAGTTAWTDGRMDGWIASAVQRVGQDGRRWSRELGPKGQRLGFGAVAWTASPCVATEHPKSNRLAAEPAPSTSALTRP